MVTCGIALLVASVVHVATEIIAFRQGMVENLSSLAQVIGNNSTAALFFEDQQAAEKTLSALRTESQIVAAFVLNDSDELFAQYTRTGQQGIVPDPHMKP